MLHLPCDPKHRLLVLIALQIRPHVAFQSHPPRRRAQMLHRVQMTALLIVQPKQRLHHIVLLPLPFRELHQPMRPNRGPKRRRLLAKPLEIDPAPPPRGNQLRLHPIPNVRIPVMSEVVLPHGLPIVREVLVEEEWQPGDVGGDGGGFSAEGEGLFEAALADPAPGTHGVADDFDFEGEGGRGGRGIWRGLGGGDGDGARVAGVGAREANTVVASAALFFHDSWDSFKWTGQ
mmetsp:Transcript_8236/g.20533  ORF Transcript_8236/g.20533 Transcript_8236/m.20533 type:complete len:232 (+) Transcript_8236:649-1344(+)